MYQYMSSEKKRKDKQMIRALREHVSILLGFAVFFHAAAIPGNASIITTTALPEASSTGGRSMFSGIAAQIINFDSFSDGDFVSTQIPLIAFSNTKILTAGQSLSEFEAPPHSAPNVATDFGGPVETTQAASPDFRVTSLGPKGVSTWLMIEFGRYLRRMPGRQFIGLDPATTLARSGEQVRISVQSNQRMNITARELSK